MNDSSVFRARLSLVLAAVLWSLSGLLTRLLQNPTVLEVHEPKLEPMHLAFYRSLFAGLFFIPFLSLAGVRFRWLMLGMVGTFAAMNAMFLSAMAIGTAANAILLQNSAPIWVYLVSVNLMKEKADHRSLQAILIGMVGILLILVSGLHGDFQAQLPVMALGLGSGLTYAGIILFLRVLRKEASQWLVLLNHLGAAACLCLAMFLILGPAGWWKWITWPSTNQILFLAFFGVVQMGIPYWLFTRSLKSVSPQEAGIITLLEPVLNPLWAYLIDPEKEKMPPATMIGGGILLFALVWRYLPQKTVSEPANSAPS